MICPSCGFEQPAGETCSQCQTPLVTVFKDSTPDESKPAPPSSSVAEPGVSKRPVEKPAAPSSKIDSPESVAEPEPEVQPVKAKASPPEREKSAPAKDELPRDGIQERLTHLEQLVVTTTSGVDGRQILVYHGIVTASVLIKGYLVKERLQDLVGEVVNIRSSSLEGVFEKARAVALADVKVEAAKRGANAVVGLTLNQSPGTEGIWLHFTGTAVTLKG